MSMNRREFLQMLAVASAGGLAIDSRDALSAQTGAQERFYEVPNFGNVSVLHFTDCHAQLQPIYFREPSLNLGVGAAFGQAPHLLANICSSTLRFPIILRKPMHLPI